MLFRSPWGGGGESKDTSTKTHTTTPTPHMHNTPEHSTGRSRDGGRGVGRGGGEKQPQQQLDDVTVCPRFSPAGRVRLRFTPRVSRLLATLVWPPPEMPTLQRSVVTREVIGAGRDEPFPGPLSQANGRGPAQLKTVLGSGPLLAYLPCALEGRTISGAHKCTEWKGEPFPGSTSTFPRLEGRTISGDRYPYTTA